MTKKGDMKSDAPIKTQKDFELYEASEAGLFYVMFDNDAVVEQGRITFAENEANRIFEKILSELLEDYENTGSLSHRNRIADQIAGLKIIPLRIH